MNVSHRLLFHHYHHQVARSKSIAVSRVRFARGVGGGGLTLPMIFLTPRVSVDLSSWGSILTPVLVLHVSSCGASTLSPVGDPPIFFLQIGHWPFPRCVVRKTIRCSPQCCVKSKVERFEITLDCSKPGLTRSASWVAPINRDEAISGCS